jgi:hypothetical protein
MSDTEQAYLNLGHYNESIAAGTSPPGRFLSWTPPSCAWDSRRFARSTVFGHVRMPSLAAELRGDSAVGAVG